MHNLPHENEAVESTTELSFCLARQPEQREGAFRLVYNSYLRSGLGCENRYQMRVTPFHLLDTTQIFVGQIRDEVVSTVTLIPDADLGLPMEGMYPHEIADLREQGANVAEVSCLADRRQDPRRFLAAFCQLTRLMAQFARRTAIDQLLVISHPRHARFYVKYLGFRQIGGLASCPHVQHRPAVALSLDFDRIDRERPACYLDFFGETIPAAELEPYTLPYAEREALAPLVAASSQYPLGIGPTVGLGV